MPPLQGSMGKSVRGVEQMPASRAFRYIHHVGVTRNITACEVRWEALLPAQLMFAAAHV